MIIKKITIGFVIQTYDTDQQNWTGQEFVAGDDLAYERADGVTLDPALMVDAITGTEPYLPCEMTQPHHVDNWLSVDRPVYVRTGVCVGMSGYVKSIRGRTVLVTLIDGCTTTFESHELEKYDPKTKKA